MTRMASQHAAFGPRGEVQLRLERVPRGGGKQQGNVEALSGSFRGMRAENNPMAPSVQVIPWKPPK